MRKLAIDFAPTSALQQVARAGWIEALLVLLALLCALALWWLLGSSTEQNAAWQAQLDRVNQVSATAVSQTSETQPPPLDAAQVQLVNTAIRQLNLPWAEVLSALEQSTPRGIALLTIEPDAARQELKLSAEAANLEAMLDYVTRLRQQRFFTSVDLQTHQIDEQDPQQAVRFELEARWRAGDQARGVDLGQGLGQAQSMGQAEGIDQARAKGKE